MGGEQSGGIKKDISEMPTNRGSSNTRADGRLSAPIRHIFVAFITSVGSVPYGFGAIYG